MARQTRTERARGRPNQHGKRRMEVLRAAARVFSEEGFRQATLEGVAGELGITRPALYHYSRSKDELLSECDLISRRLLETALEEAKLAATGLGQLQAFFRSYAAIISDEFGRCFVLTAQSEMSDEQRKSTKQFQRELAAIVTAMIQGGVNDGSICACAPQDVSRAMFGAFNGIARWRTASERRTSRQIADAFLNLFVNGLQGTVGSPQERLCS